VPTTAKQPDAPTLDVNVAYVVVAYRSERHLDGCLDAIASDRPEGSQIVVVDNASPDRSNVIALHHASKPRIVRSTTNDGFGAGCNLGAKDTTADFLFFVNPDARLQLGATSVLLARLRNDPGISALGPRVDGPGGHSGVASAGFEPSIRSALGHFLLLARLPALARVFPPLQLPPLARAGPVDWVSGAALLIRASDFRSVGGFDESMFLYMEDVDLCRRLRDAGRVIWYEPTAKVEHDLGGSQGEEQPARWYRAFHAYVTKRRGNGYARLVSLIAALGLGARAFVGATGNKAKARRLRRAALTAAGEALRPGSRETPEST